MTARQRRSATLLAVLALAAILIHQLIVPPIVGLADNGDYSRLWNRFGIHSTLPEGEARYFAYVVRDWRVDPSKTWDTGFDSPDVYLLHAAMLANPLFAVPGHFDLRSLALVRIALFLMAAALLVRAACHAGRWPAAAAFVVLAVVFADVGYVSYFNSGYAEPSSFLFTLFTIAFFATLVARVPPSYAGLAGFFASIALLTWSKPQNILVAIPLALFALRLVVLRGSLAWKAAVVTGTVAVVAAAVHMRATPLPLWYQQQVRHIAVFNVILPSSPDPRADLHELGLPESLASLSGHYPWSTEVARRHAELEAVFHPAIDEAKIARFLLLRPGRIRHLLGLAAPQAWWVRSGLGNFEAASGRPPGARATAYAWRSDFVQRHGPSSLRTLAIVAALAAVLAIGYRRRCGSARGRLVAEGVLCLLACAALQFATVATLQGHRNEEKGMMLFAVLFDAAIVTAAGLGVALLAGRRTGRRIGAPAAGPD
jgi:hypothetical protein